MLFLLRDGFGDPTLAGVDEVSVGWRWVLVGVHTFIRRVGTVRVKASGKQISPAAKPRRARRSEEAGEHR
jgi:hypothetical protein